MNGENKHLSVFIDSLQARGTYFLSKSSMLQDLKVSDASLKSSIKRLFKKQRLVSLKKDLYLIVPLEYRNIGAPPPEWFIDRLMNAHNTKYYVGLLTAAALHGAAHQQPQIYQVITNKLLRPIKIGRARIVFYFKKDFDNLPLVKIKTPTGYMAVSSPELTAFDLVSYLKQSGHIHHVSTVLAELGEEIDPQKLYEVAEHFSQGCIQRTGYLLDVVGFHEKTGPLLKRVSSKYYPLRSDRKWSLEPKNKEWHVYVNEEVESDL